MFTREDISSSPLPDAKFQEAKSHYLGQLIVIPEMLAKTIKAMKDNKPSLDGIPPRRLMETVEQISIPLVKRILQTCRPYRKKDINMFKRIQRRATQMIS